MRVYDALPTLNIPASGLSSLNEFASLAGETPRNYIIGSLQLVGIWGRVISAYDMPPVFYHGVANTETDSIDIVDIPGIIKYHSIRPESHPAQVAQKTKNGLQLTVPIEMLPEIAVATSYYNATLQQLARVALNIRAEVLQRLDDCGVYLFSADQEEWLEVDVLRVIQDPSYN